MLVYVITGVILGLVLFTAVFALGYHTGRKHLKEVYDLTWESKKARIWNNKLMEEKVYERIIYITVEKYAMGV